MAAGGAGGRGCNPLGAGPWLCTSGSIPGAWCRTRISSLSGRVRTLLGFALTGEGRRSNPERFLSPRCATVTPPFPAPPPLRSWAWWGGTLHLRSDAGCSAGSASAAAARPERCPLAPGSLPETRGPEALTGLRRRALPAGSMELPDLRVRPQRRPENGRRLLGPSAPFHPGAGRRAARPLADAQASGRLRVAGLQPPVPPLQSRLGQDCGVTEQALSTGRAQASRTQVLCNLSRTKFSGTRCHFPMTVRGGLDYSPTV